MLLCALNAGDGELAEQVVELGLRTLALEHAHIDLHHRQKRENEIGDVT